MTCHCTRLNDPRAPRAAHARTEQSPPKEHRLQVTNPAKRTGEHGIIMFHVCSKQVQKDSSPEGEEKEQASPLREHRQTLLLPPRWWPRSR